MVFSYQNRGHVWVLGIYTSAACARFRDTLPVHGCQCCERTARQPRPGGAAPHGERGAALGGGALMGRRSMELSSSMESEKDMGDTVNRSILFPQSDMGDNYC